MASEEQWREYQRTWREKNRVRVRESQADREDTYKCGVVRSPVETERASKKRAYQRAYYAAHKEQEIARSKADWQRQKGNIEQNRAKRWKLRYGLTTEQYEAILQSQEGKCALCEVGKPIDIDHNHSTGRVRGILCRSCNVGLGQLGDSINGLKKAIAYLERTGG